MARSRNIKPGFFCNDDLVELDFAARLLFAGLWTIADREGRLEDRPKKIKISVFPADNVDIDGMLEVLASRKFIKRYTVDGIGYIQVVNWSKHQNPHHTEKPSVIPPPPNGEVTVKEPEQDGGNLADSLSTDSPIPDSITVPNGTGGDAALTKDEIWRAGKSLLEQQGMPKAQTGSYIGKLCKDYPPDVVLTAVRAAVVARPADAASYLKAACQHARGERIAPHLAKQIETIRALTGGMANPGGGYAALTVHMD